MPEFPWIQRGLDLQFQQSHIFLADKVDTVKQGKSASKKKGKKKISVKVSTVAPCQNTLHVGAANKYRKIELIGRLDQPRFKLVQLHQNMLHVGVAPVTEQSKRTVAKFRSLRRS